MSVFEKPMTRAQKILNAVVIPPPESEIEDSSDSEVEIGSDDDSNCESEAPSMDSAMEELINELSDFSD